MIRALFSKPEFYDLFGLPTFGFITLTALWTLLTKNTFPNWAVYVLLIVGILGVLVDGTIVYHNFIKKVKKVLK